MQYQGTGQLSGSKPTTASSIYNAECTVYRVSLCTNQTQNLGTTTGALAALNNISELKHLYVVGKYFSLILVNGFQDTESLTLL